MLPQNGIISPSSDLTIGITEIQEALFFLHSLQVLIITLFSSTRICNINCLDTAMHVYIKYICTRPLKLSTNVACAGTYLSLMLSARSV